MQAGWVGARVGEPAVEAGIVRGKGRAAHTAIGHPAQAGVQHAMLEEHNVPGAVAGDSVHLRAAREGKAGRWAAGAGAQEAACDQGVPN